MPPLAALERFFERLFERPTARFFRTRLQPVQLQRRIERAMESERLAATDRTLVPNRYTIHLNPDDVAAFGEFGSTLAAELADSALVFARAHRYTLVDRPRVELVSDPAVERADIVVKARFADPATGRSAPGGPAEHARDEDPATNTMVFTVPRPEAPRARLRLIQTGTPERVVELDGRTVTLGRATDNGLVLADGRVSRHHGRISVRRGTLVYTDLQSTNGSRVNGTAVDEVVLGVGDRIEVGDTLLVIEAVQPGGNAVGA
jgi:FhaA, N-terminal domain/FHA domain